MIVFIFKSVFNFAVSVDLIIDILKLAGGVRRALVIDDYLFEIV